MKFNKLTAEQIMLQYTKDYQKLSYQFVRMVKKMKSPGITSLRWKNPQGLEYFVITRIFNTTHKIVHIFIPIGGVQGRESYYTVDDFDIHRNKRGMCHFTNHFMHRYMERAMKQNIFIEEKVLTNFLEKNYTSVKMWQNEDLTEFIFALNTGIALCHRDPETNICHFCTFISNDMLKEEQLESYKIMREILNIDTELYSGKYGHEGDPRFTVISNMIEERARKLLGPASEIIQKYKNEMKED